MAGVGEEGHGGAVLVDRVPASVVEVEVGEQDDIDIPGLHAGGFHHRWERGLLLEGHGGGAAAEAGVDEDGVALADHQPGTEVEGEVAVAVEELAVGGPGVGGNVGKEHRRGHGRPTVLESDELGVSDLRALKLSHREPPAARLRGRAVCDGGRARVYGRDSDR